MAWAPMPVDGVRQPRHRGSLIAARATGHDAKARPDTMCSCRDGVPELVIELL
jgi:hypothetical protein